MTCTDCHGAFVAGYELGLAIRCRLDTEAGQHEARHALVRPVVAAVLADMNRRGMGGYEALQDRRRAQQIEACERLKAAAIPWPDEVTP